MTTAINPMPEIERMIKTLCLSGFLESLGVRNKEAIQNKLTYPEFLSLLLQDEVLRRQQKKFYNRIKKAGFKSDKTLERFDFGFNPNINKAQILDVASCNFIEEKVCVLIMGPTGTGKSHLAQAIGHRAVRNEIDTIFGTQTKLLTNLTALKATGRYRKYKRFLIKVPLLIIDDFGLKPLRTPEEEELHELISERYENAATILTSNLAFDEWIEAFPNRLLGIATLDRLRHGAYKIILDGKSYRCSKNEQYEMKNGTLKTDKKE